MQTETIKEKIRADISGNETVILWKYFWNNTDGGRGHSNKKREKRKNTSKKRKKWGERTGFDSKKCSFFYKKWLQKEKCGILEKICRKNIKY